MVVVANHAVVALGTVVGSQGTATSTFIADDSRLPFLSRFLVDEGLTLLVLRIHFKVARTAERGPHHEEKTLNSNKVQGIHNDAVVRYR